MKKERMHELVDLLNRANKAYYEDGQEILANIEFDALYLELEGLEQELGYALNNSPTQKVEDIPNKEGFKKVKHMFPALSLTKSKDPEDIKKWLKTDSGLISWKMDGLTLVATYLNGVLKELVTRGNGEIGEDVTFHANDIIGLPTRINFDGTLVVRGEGHITYSDFEVIKEKEPERDFKNPRNLVAGSIRTLQKGICKQRMVRFSAFDVCNPIPEITKKSQAFSFLKDLGFSVVEYEFIDTVENSISSFGDKVGSLDIPVDGLVFSIDNLEIARKRGNIGKYSLDSMAFKWKDDTKETVVKEIFWSASKSGLLNPVAIFEPIELEGTTVSRASIHNISIAKQLRIGVGAKISVYKANMIIPQVKEVVVPGEAFEIPNKCPICGSETKIKCEEETETLLCENPICAAKSIKLFAHFVSRDAMNVEGLSEKKIEVLISNGIISTVSDLFFLENKKDKIVSLDGFGESSFQNMIKAIEKSKEVLLNQYIYALGIPIIGHDLSKKIAEYCEYSYETFLVKFLNGDLDWSYGIDGFGPVAIENLNSWAKNGSPIMDYVNFSHLLTFKKPEKVAVSQNLKGMNFVITGSVFEFKNRDELKSYIENCGGKVSGSVSKNTTYLINNDIESTSGKNKTAKELGVPIINEDTFKKL